MSPKHHCLAKVAWVVAWLSKPTAVAADAASNTKPAVAPVPKVAIHREGVGGGEHPFDLLLERQRRRAVRLRRLDSAGLAAIQPEP